MENVLKLLRQKTEIYEMQEWLTYNPQFISDHFNENLHHL